MRIIQLQEKGHHIIYVNADSVQFIRELAPDISRVFFGHGHYVDISENIMDLSEKIDNNFSA